ncbi:SCO3242 family prenyltransferase [Streptomyces sp. NPDC001178]
MTRRASQAGDGATEGGRAARPERTDADHPNRRQAWAELLRLPALFTVPGDALAGAAATAAAPNPRTLLAIGSSLCLYEAGMALNDWADRDEDAAERPHRPLPSGRIHPAAALTAACAFTGAGLALATRAGRPALAVAAPLAATVWAYDLALKHTSAGPVAMAAARGLDLLLGAAATTGRTRDALGPAALLGTHTLAVTAVSRQETRGGSPLAPLSALAATGLLSWLVGRRPSRPSAGRRETAGRDLVAGRQWDRARSERPVATWRQTVGVVTGALEAPRGLPGDPAARRAHGLASGADSRIRPTCGPAPEKTSAALRLALAAAYAATAVRPYLHAALNPSPPLTQRAVTGGIRATIPLQAALTARSGAGAGAGVNALLVAALAPLGRRFGRKVSVT